MKTDVTDVESSKQHFRIPLLGQEIGKKEHVKYRSFLCNLLTTDIVEIHFASRRAMGLNLGGIMEIW